VKRGLKTKNETQKGPSTRSPMKAGGSCPDRLTSRAEEFFGEGWGEGKYLNSHKKDGKERMGID